MKKEIKLLMIILIVAIALRILFIYSSPLRWWDETVYANIGYDLSKNPFDYSLINSSWGDYIPDGSWPHLGFRPPFLPYILSVIYFFKVGFLISLLMPLFGSLTALFVYFIGRKFYSEKTGLIAALFIALLPIHTFFSSRILNDVLATFLITLAFLFFWKGFEENKLKYKILFGIVMGLALLSRYTVLWIFPVFLAYFLLKKSFKIFFDKGLLLSIASFFIVLLPWFIYGFFEYGNILGAFMHGLKSAFYWGGIQPWNFFFHYSWKIFSILGIIFIVAISYIFYKRDYSKQNVLLLLWIFIFLTIASLMPHKEERFILPIIPAICLICGYLFSKIEKKYLYIFILLPIIFLSFSLFTSFFEYYNQGHNINNRCFIDSIDYLRNLKEPYLLISENPPIFYYYIKNENRFYPALTKEYLMSISSNKDIYFIFTRLGSGLNSSDYYQLREIFNNFEQVYNCSLDPEVNIIYKRNI
jgi:4-amino-4-deoxy-L-arabinose transferase-like glycosyltransferase